MYIPRNKEIRNKKNIREKENKEKRGKTRETNTGILYVRTPKNITTLIIARERPKRGRRNTPSLRQSCPPGGDATRTKRAKHKQTHREGHHQEQARYTYVRTKTMKTAVVRQKINKAKAITTRSHSLEAAAAVCCTNSI